MDPVLHMQASELCIPTYNSGLFHITSHLFDCANQVPSPNLLGIPCIGIC